LTFALEHATDTDRWVFPDYNAGLAGYDAWIDALSSRRADPMGMAYNAAVWQECRSYAARFLQEARERLDGPAAGPLAEATACYQMVSEHLATLAELFPCHGDDPSRVRDKERVSAAICALQSARSAEVLGLEGLRAVVAAL
jgi:hypothetical protein